MIFDADSAAALAADIAHSRPDVVGIDCETTGIDPRKDPAAGPKGRIVCWSIAWERPNLGPKVEVVWANADTWRVLGKSLRALPVVGHNIFGFDAHMFRKSGFPLDSIVGDTLRMHRLINPDENAEHGLKALIKWWLNEPTEGDFLELFGRRKCLGVEELEFKQCKRKVDGVMVPTILEGAISRLGAGKEPLLLSEIPEHYPHLLPVLERYAALDAVATLRLYRLFQAKLKETPWNPPILQ